MDKKKINYRILSNLLLIVGFVVIFLLIGFGITNFELLLLYEGWAIVVVLMFAIEGKRKISMKIKNYRDNVNAKLELKNDKI